LATPDGAFDDAVRRGDPDRWLASRFISDPAARADVVTLLAFDLELARAPRVTSNPLTAEIRLVWWREVLEEAFAGRPVRAHPLAQALADVIRRRDLPQARLEALIDARRICLFEPIDSMESAVAWADGVAASAALCAARILDAASPETPVKLAGRTLGLAGLLRAGTPIEGLRERLTDSLSAANAVLGALSPRAFPAVAAATFARDALSGRSAPELARRLRLVWAVARGRI
jgi:phytoene synthase